MLLGDMVNHHLDVGVVLLVLLQFIYDLVDVRAVIRSLSLWMPQPAPSRAQSSNPERRCCSKCETKEHAVVRGGLFDENDEYDPSQNGAQTKVNLLRFGQINIVSITSMC